MSGSKEEYQRAGTDEEDVEVEEQCEDEDEDEDEDEAVIKERRTKRSSSREIRSTSTGRKS
eukprot:123270-Hanusia_phi.AAC.1